MSLINQVLSDLEKRGANALPGEPAIRPVSAQGNRRKVVLPVAGVLVLLFVATGLWWGNQQRKSTAPESVAPISAPQAPAKPVTAPQAPAKPVAAPQAASQPAAIAAQEVPQKDSVQEVPQKDSVQEAGASALRLSFELTSIPLPSSLRAKPVLAEAPVISSVSPNPVVATGAAQQFKINGSNFARGATVTLRISGGQVYANRPARSQSAVQIVINPNFGTTPGAWTAEVINPGSASSGPFAFTVQAPLAAASGQGHNKTVSSPATGNKIPAAAHAPAGMAAGRVDKQIKQVSVQQQADNEFRRASGLMQQGHVNEALAGYEAALQLDAGHAAARQAMVGLLLENKRNADAERVLQDGLKHNPKHSGFAMLLARLQVERNELALALETLQKTLPYADQQPDYQAFVAALLQRQGRHDEAITHYRIALQLSPDSGVWLMGLGISLQAAQRNEEARDAFKRAIESRTLSAELQAFIKQRLKEL